MRVKERTISSNITDNVIAESESGTEIIGEYIGNRFDMNSLEVEGNDL